MSRFVALPLVWLALAGAAVAQPVSQGTANISPRDTRGEVAPPLPTPPLDANAPPSAFLRSAQGAVIAGRLGEAQEALEMAQTRLLDRSVPLFQTNTPSGNPAVRSISLALQTLSAGDREGAIRHIQAALPTADDVGR
jgi:hypothetical protein